MIQTDKKWILGENVPFTECHASTLLRLRDGSFLCAWFGGSKEGNDDVMIWCSRREQDNWSEPRCITEEAGIPHWNPVLFQTDENTVALYYKVGKQIPYWITMVMISHDDGITWSAAKELVPGDEGGRGPVKNKPIRGCDGCILAPASIEQGPWRCFVDKSWDGIHWDKKPIPVSDPKIFMIQPSLWEQPAHHIHALMRTSAGFVYRSDSHDCGESWCLAYATDIPNNNSGLDCVLLKNGKLALVCNPVGKDWGPRTPLTLFVSEDNGDTFRKVMDLETEPGEYSYPAVISHENKLFISYTWNRKNIAFWEITL